MSEDLTAAAALSIERYIAGLRAELTLLGSAESDDLIYEIRDMLLDAAREDPRRAFAEMERLGEPSRLATSLLAERGIATDGAMPTAAWWRMGIAATIDIVVGLAAPVAVGIAFYGTVWNALNLTPTFDTASGTAAAFAPLAVVGSVFVVACVLAWRSWAPWRNGGRSATAGMAIMKIAVLRIGGTRSVVTVSELESAGLAVPGLSGVPFGASIASVALAVLILAWAASMVSAGALDPSGAGLVARLAGPAAQQKMEVSAAVYALYEAARTNVVWPAIDEKRLDPANIKKSLVEMFGGTSSGADPGFDMVPPSETSPGIWQVSVTEAPDTAKQRDVVLIYALRYEWVEDGQPSPTWVLVAYNVFP